MPLECDETPGPLTRCGNRLLSADGNTFVFAMCHLDSSGSSTTDVRLYRRRSDGTRDALGDAGALGLSSDGGRLLIYDAEAVSVVNAEGTRTALPFPLQLSWDARLSGDGATVFGAVANGAGGRTLARWTQSGGLETFEGLALLSAAVSWELAAVSADGAVVVGYADDGTRPVPFRWTAAGGIEDLGALPEGVVGARPTAISADGSTIAGFTVRSGSDADVFRWTAQDQLQLMGTALPVASWPDAGTLLLSADGAVLAGAALNATPRLVRWGSGGTAVASAEPPAFVTDMTPDGSVLTGFTYGGTGFLWRPPVVEPTTPTSAYDVTRLDTLLEQSGADSSGWALENITNISDDGRIIYGGGTCGGVPTYYRMQLRP
jgi:hypothetical protein